MRASLLGGPPLSFAGTAGVLSSAVAAAAAFLALESTAPFGLILSDGRLDTPVGLADPAAVETDFLPALPAVGFLLLLGAALFVEVDVAAGAAGGDGAGLAASLALRLAIVSSKTNESCDKTLPSLEA